MVQKFMRVKEHLIERRNIFDNTIQDRPEKWTAGVWKEVYQFPNSGAGMAIRNDTFVNGKFSHMVDPKDGYLVRDCRDAKHQRLQEFIVPIIHLDKPTQVTITIGNIIFNALDGRSVDWGLVCRDLAQKLVAGAEKTKPTSTSTIIEIFSQKYARSYSTSTIIEIFSQKKRISTTGPLRS